MIKKKVDTLDAMINILAYDLASGKAAEFASKNFLVFLLDESHYLKNKQAKRSQALNPVLAKARRLFLLSGK